MYLQTKTKCPYCGHEQVLRIDGKDCAVGREIISCDSEDGGCDDYYVALYKVSVSATSFTIGRDTVPGNK